MQNVITERMVPNKVMLVFGARRVGKTMLLKNICKEHGGRIMTLNGEDRNIWKLLEPMSSANYQNLLQGYDLLVIDEAQHIPDIGQKLKFIVDEIQGLKIIASGSSSFDLKNQAGEPLVGRATQFTLCPFALDEIRQTQTNLEIRQNIDERVIYGSYPEVVTTDNYVSKQEYLTDLVDLYLIKDILAVDGVKNSSKLYALLQLVAYQVGSEISYDELGKQLGMSRNTVERYLDLLQKVFVIFRLGGYSGNLRKEVTKSSKWYFYDVGIRNAIINNFQPLNIRPATEQGALWENFVISEIIKRNHNRHGLNKFYFWRTYDQQEIDLIETDLMGGIKAFEIKLHKARAKCPIAFQNAYPNASFQIINKDNYHEFLL